MDYNKLFRGFYFITDSGLSRNGSVRDVYFALQAGVRVVQYREKLKPKAEKIAELTEILELCGISDAICLVNDDVELAVEVGAHGIHLGQGDMALYDARKLTGNGMIIGVSVSTLSEALEAKMNGANYLGAGHIYPTSTKEKLYPPIGVDVLKNIVGKVDIPIVAIGGIHRDNVKSVINTGVSMVAALSDSLAHGRVTENILEYQKLFGLCQSSTGEL